MASRCHVTDATLRFTGGVSGESSKYFVLAFSINVHEIINFTQITNNRNANIMKFCTLPTINLLLLATANSSCAFQVLHRNTRASHNFNSLQNANIEKVCNDEANDGMSMRMRMRTINSQLALYQDFNNEDFGSNAEDHDSFIFSESDRARIQKQYER